MDVNPRRTYTTNFLEMLQSVWRGEHEYKIKDYMIQWSISMRNFYC
jgi:hypothetical protein